MSITEFVGLFDKKKVEEGKLRFFFYPPNGFPFTCWCDVENGSSYENFIKDISENYVLNQYVIAEFAEVNFIDKEDYIEGDYIEAIVKMEKKERR